MCLKDIKLQVKNIFEETIKAGELKDGDIIVLGCSSSEILGEHIGKSGSVDVGQAVISTALEITNRQNLHLAVQCCEHLNRALVVTKFCALEYNLEIVRVCPTPAAGGSCGSVAYQLLPNAVVVEFIKAHAAIDIGDTHIGMHVKFVQVPFRPTIKKVGQAHVTALTSRPKLIGGIRAKYD